MLPNQLFNMASAGMFVSRNLRNIARLPGNCRALQTSSIVKDSSPTHTGQVRVFCEYFVQSQGTNGVGHRL